LKPIQISHIQPKKLAGMSLRMSLSENRTRELWNRFMPLRSAITNRLNADFISMQLYDLDLNFQDFTPHTSFEKWAVVEVEDFDNIPESMSRYELKGGLYAVFHHKGDETQFMRNIHSIYTEWLPASEYTFDSREHFEVLGAKYKNNDPDSEEEIWVPVKAKILV
jgi:AraC family transcriptional regulator